MDYLAGHPAAVLYYLVDLFVDDLGGLLGVLAVELTCSVAHWDGILAHAQAGYDLLGEGVGFLEIVVGTGCDAAEEELFGASTSEDEADAVDELLFGLEFRLAWEVLGKAESTFGTRDYCNF